MKFFKSSLIIAVVAALVGTASAELKIATVDVQKVFKDYYKTHDAQKELDGQREKVQAENNKRIEKIQEIEKELNDLKKQIEDPSISEANKQKLTGQFQIKNSEGVALDQERRVYLERQNRALGEHMKKKMTDIVAEINAVTDEKARENNFDLVLDKSGLTIAQTRIVMYSKENFDITDSVLKVLNASAPEGFDPSALPAPKVPAATTEGAEPVSAPAVK